MLFDLHQVVKFSNSKTQCFNKSNDCLFGNCHFTTFNMLKRERYLPLVPPRWGLSLRGTFKVNYITPFITHITIQLVIDVMRLFLLIKRRSDCCRISQHLILMKRESFKSTILRDPQSHEESVSYWWIIKASKLGKILTVTPSNEMAAH